jgi:hypothetical protein
MVKPETARHPQSEGSVTQQIDRHAAAVQIGVGISGKQSPLPTPCLGQPLFGGDRNDVEVRPPEKDGQEERAIVTGVERSAWEKRSSATRANVVSVLQLSQRQPSLVDRHGRQRVLVYVHTTPITHLIRLAVRL